MANIRISKSWYDESVTDKTLCSAVIDAVDAIDKLEGSDRRREIERYLRVYGGRQLIGLSLGNYYKISNVSNILSGDRIRWNVTKAVIDTVQARIAKNQPAPMYLTERGDYSNQLQSKRLAQYVKGIFYQSKVYDIGPEIFRDAAVIGTGIAKVYLDEPSSSIRVERCFPWEIYVDPIEAIYGSPRSLYQTKFVDRSQLIALFPEFEEDLSRADNDYDASSGFSIETSDLIRVYECWRLPSAQDATDGRHAICIKGKVLVDEKYDRNTFPFVFLHWSTRVMGFWGQGLVEDLLPLQVEINKQLQSIQMNHHLGSNPMVLKERGSKIEEGHFNNAKFNIIDYTGTPPQIVAFATTNPEIYNHLERLYQRAFELAGVSQMSAGGSVPAAVQGSGRAMLVHNDIESARFNITSQRYERFFMELCDQIVDVSAQAHKNGIDLQINGSVKRGRSEYIEKIKWSEVNMTDKAFERRLFPVSSLPDQPAGKLAFLTELSQILPIDPVQLMKLMDFPDLDGFINQEAAGLDSIYESMEKIIEDGEYTSPEPFDNLKAAVSIANAYYLRGRLNNLPEERLQLLRDYIQSAVTLMTPPEPPPPPPGQEVPPGMGMPPDMGMPPEMPPELMGGEGGGAPPMPPDMMPPAN